MTEILPLNAITDLARASYPVCSRDRARQGCRARASMDGFTACRGSRQGSLRRNQGFTLIEMVAVMVLLSFGLIAGTQLFTMTAQSYRDTSVRMKQTQDGRFVIERISRELREALPSSVRESSNSTTQCIEWLPIVAASRYLSTPAAIHFPVMEINPDLTAGTTYYAVIFPVGSGTVYNGAAAGTALRLMGTTPMNAASESDFNTDEIYLAATPVFTNTSPSDRIFFTTTPVAICVQSNGVPNNGNMLRYSNYGFVAQATTLTGGVLLAENVLLDDGGTVDVFNFSDATMTRNSMVQLDLRMRDPSTQEVLRLQHTVFIRNVP
jgi:MSHA biogenesis protein MshO